MCNESVLEHDWEPHNSLRATGTQVLEASGTEKKINEVGELYRPSAERAAFFFFIIIIISHPCKINPVHRFPLKVRPLAWTLAQLRRSKCLSDHILAAVSWVIWTLSSYVVLYRHWSVYPSLIKPQRTGAESMLTEVVTCSVFLPASLREASYPLWHTVPSRWETQATSEVGPPVIFINQSTFLPPH